MPPKKSTKNPRVLQRVGDMPIIPFQGGKGYVCPVCKGSGRGYKKSRAWSPRDGYYEYDEPTACSRCYGHGVIPLGRPDW